MKKSTQMITGQDLKRLLSIIDDVSFDPAVVARVEDKLDLLEVIEPTATPNDLITMNTVIKSKVCDDGVISAHERVITLVFPRAAAISDGRISVMTPLGAELLGARAGDQVSWNGYDGVARQLIVEAVIYQPESHGDWHL